MEDKLDLHTLTRLGIVDQNDPHSFISAREYFLDKLSNRGGTAATQNNEMSKVSHAVMGSFFNGNSVAYMQNQEFMYTGGSSSFTLSQQAQNFDKKKLTRKLDELQHKYKTMMERKNRMVQELNQLREYQNAYCTIEEKIIG